MTTHRFTSTADAVAHFEAQGACPPGTEAFWKVWGARPHAIRPGDLVATLVDDDLHWDLILDTFEAKAAPMRVGLVTAEGERITLGALLPVQVLRWETHHTLA